MTEALAATTDTVLRDCPSNLWPTLRLQLASAASSASDAAAAALAPLGAAPDVVSAAQQRLRDGARALVEERARRAAKPDAALERMRERFGAAFSRDERGYPRTWRAHPPTDAPCEPLVICSALSTPHAESQRNCFPSHPWRRRPGDDIAAAASAAQADAARALGLLAALRLDEKLDDAGAFCSRFASLLLGVFIAFHCFPPLFRLLSWPPRSEL